MPLKNHRSVNDPKGRLIIIGGHEEKQSSQTRELLTEVVKAVDGGKLVVATVASNEQEKVWHEYRKVFQELGVKNLVHLKVDSRIESLDVKKLEAIKGARGVFFTGGDQLKITSVIGGTELCRSIQNVFQEGGLIAGTSAGASVMSENMLVSGPNDESVRSKSDVQLAPGLGFVRDIIIDQHFAERGRISRLMAAVALNPKLLGLGIDENTAVFFNGENEFQVLGGGSVYVLNAQGATSTNISEMNQKDTLSIHNVNVHVLSSGEKFNVIERQPVLVSQQKSSEMRRAARSGVAIQ